MAVNDVVGGVLSSGSVFRPATGVSILILRARSTMRATTTGSNELTLYNNVRTDLLPVGINRNFYLRASNVDWYSGIQVA